ncbi:hypothetical protein [Polaromonas sp.]|uniref:hypothetical protein n=1 Tax=Polaromonas sp. TaxID=1869339 RepID=UPI00286CCE25|nr:hypothetical protein [Polaromonas sp.]
MVTLAGAASSEEDGADIPLRLPERQRRAPAKARPDRAARGDLNKRESKGYPLEKTIAIIACLKNNFDVSQT